MVVGPTGIAAGVSATCNVIPGFGVTQNGYAAATAVATAAVVAPVRIVSPAAGRNELRFTVKNPSTTKRIFAQFVGYDSTNADPSSTFNSYFATVEGVTGNLATNMLGSLTNEETGWGATFTYPLPTRDKAIIPANATCLLGPDFSLGNWNSTSFNTYLFVNDNGGETGTIAFTSAAAPYRAVLNQLMPTIPAPTETIVLTNPAPDTMQVVISGSVALPLYSIAEGRPAQPVYNLVVVSGNTILGAINKVRSRTPIPKVGATVTLLLDVNVDGRPLVSDLPSGTVCDVYLMLWRTLLKVFPGALTWYGNTFKFCKPTFTAPSIIPFLQIGNIVVQNPSDLSGASDYNLSDTLVRINNLAGVTGPGGGGESEIAQNTLDGVTGISTVLGVIPNKNDEIETFGDFLSTFKSETAFNFIELSAGLDNLRKGVDVNNFLIPLPTTPPPEPTEGETFEPPPAQEFIVTNLQTVLTAIVKALNIDIGKLRIDTQGGSGDTGPTYETANL
jgi:hypothetical protein